MNVLVPILFISFVLTFSGAKKVIVNDQVDSFLNKTYKLKTNHRFLNITIGEIPMQDGSPKVDFAEGALLGVDSLSRTGDCFQVQEGPRKTFSIQIGLRLLVLALPRVSLRGVLMSAFFRVGENSLNFTYTIHDEKTCRLSVDVLKIEKFQKITFGSSRIDFDGTDVNHMFQNGIRKWINEWLDTQRPEIENRLRFRCIIPMVKEAIPPTDPAEAFNSLIEDIAIF